MLWMWLISPARLKMTRALLRRRSKPPGLADVAGCHLDIGAQTSLSD
jgi:hypothetical protein